MIILAFLVPEIEAVCADRVYMKVFLRSIIVRLGGNAKRSFEF